MEGQKGRKKKGEKEKRKKGWKIKRNRKERWKARKEERNVGIWLECLYETFIVSSGKFLLQQISFLELLLLCPINFRILCFHSHFPQATFRFLFDFFVELLV